LDEDRSGAIAINELGDVLKKWINLDLTEEQLTVVKAKFENGTGEICYKDLCQVIEDSGHPLGGGFNINGYGACENLLGRCKEKLMSYTVRKV